MTWLGWDHAAWPVLASLAESAIRTLALAGVVAIGLMALRVKRAAIRLCAWTVVLYAALGLAVLGRTIPGVDVPVPAISLIPEQWLAPRPDARIVRHDVAPDAPASRVARATRTVSAQSPLASDRVVAWPAVMAVTAYVLGVMWLLLRVVVGWVVARRLERSVQPLTDARLVARAARHAAAIGLRRAPRLAQSDRLFVPMTTSAMRPMIVLPENWRRWNAAKLDAVLAHETAHVRRRDALTQRLSLLYRAVFWVNPLSWWLHHQITELAEQASDEAALDAGVDRTTYAETLLGFFTERPVRSGRADWHVAMARPGHSSAERRVEHVLAWDQRSSTMGRSFVLAVVLAVSPVLALAAAIHPDPLVVQGLELPDLPAAPLVDFPAAPPVAMADAMAPASPPVPARSIGVFREHSPEAPVTKRVEPAEPDSPRDASAPLLVAPSVPAIPEPAVALPAVREEVAVPVHEEAPAPALMSSPRPAPTVADIQDPTLVQRVDAKYTTEAMRAKIQGVVWLDVVVLPNGTVGDVKVVKSLDPSFGLDEKAIEAARGWLFKPGTRPDPATNQRVPVVTVARLELEFRLH